MELSSRSLMTIHLLLFLLISLSFSALAAQVSDSATDRAALLSFKSQIHADPLRVLSSWNESLHHCRWQGVLCGRHHPDRVTALVLASKQLSGYLSPSLANLTFLQNIGLSDNHLQGNIPIELGYLSRLRVVNLSMNFLDGSIPSTLSNCSKLQVITLHNNNLHGAIPSNFMQCKELKIIDLIDNFLIGGIPRDFGLIPKLIVLGLSINNLTGSIPYTLGNLSSLTYLFLDENNLGGDIPDSLGRLTNLSHLYLNKNNLSGSIPLTLENLIKLSVLYLDQNNLNGHIPLFFGNLTKLLELSLYQNILSGTIPPALGNLNNIEYLLLDQNNLSGSIPDALGNLQSLQHINIYGNSISGEIPHSLYNISSMLDLELGANLLGGTLPFDMCDAFSNLQFFFLNGNQLNGRIPPSISNCSALLDIELDSNRFSGRIPSSIGILKDLYRFTIQNNQLEAKIPDDWSFFNALTNCTSLQVLDIGYNYLRGVLPSSITNFSNIHKLGLSNNPIKGAIPPDLGRLSNLDSLLLGHMRLSGTIPEEIGNLFRLEELDLSSNMISGKIPPTFGNLTRMDRLLLNDNALYGSIPPSLSNMQFLELLNLSTNKLTGEIPKEIMSLPSLSIILDLSYNYLTGILLSEIGNLRNIQSIRLSNNKLLGEIPSTIAGCQLLQALYLDSNLFQGTIPSTLINLRGLQLLDVSNNSLSGQVPEFISQTNLLYLNISFNNFEGELPKQGIFKNVSGVDVRGNPKLCGGVPELKLPQCTMKSPSQSHHSRGSIVLASSILSSFICLSIVIWFLVSCYSKKGPRNKQQYDRSLRDLKPISYNDLLRATKNFSSENLIGRGTFGTVYKATMTFDDVTTIAVKVINLEIHGASRSFFAECEALRNVRHRNLVKVLSSCSSIDNQGNDFKALIFEFMPNGSLASWLHPNIDQPCTSLGLIKRLNIAIDVASALEYLHYYGSIPIVHCDLKPSNVLLNDDMTAHVGDFGLARFLVGPDAILSQSMTSTNRIKGSIGYIPPEYGMGGRPSIEGDVYSYGILLLEIFIGISPTDERFGDSLTLQYHAEMAFPEQIMEIIDTKIFSGIDEQDKLIVSENVYSCLISVIKCGLLCSKETPKDRISIRDVLKELKSTKMKLLGT